MVSQDKPLRLTMIGLRGFPGVQGGVETHAANLCPLLVELGCDVTVIVRSSSQPSEVGPEWRGVKFVSLWAPKAKGLETVVHTFLSVLYSAFTRPDILHIQAIGPAVMTPMARLLGLRVVVTHHSQNYDHQGWGLVARTVFRLGEQFGMRWSNQRIVISSVIRQIIQNKHGKSSELIPNGVTLPAIPEATDALAPFELTPGRYVVLVSRLVPEKRHLDLIEAFKQANLTGWKLALVGASDHPDAYTQSVLNKAKATAGVVCTGLQTGQALQQLYGSAGFFVLPSSHEGLPIAMLEALSFGLPIIASDIPANLEVGLDPAHYYPLGDTNALANLLTAFAAQKNSQGARDQRRAWVASRFNWHDIATKTLDVYKSVHRRHS